MATTIGKLVVKLNSETKGFQRGLDRAARRLEAFRKKISNFGRDVRNFGLKLMAVGAAMHIPILAAAKSFAAWGDVIDKTSRRTGVAAASIAELGHVAGLTGTDMQALEKGFFGLQRSMFDASLGLSTALDAFGALGLTYDDLAKLSPEDQFYRVVEAMQGIEDAALRGAVAQKIFGRSGRQLLPLIDLGVEGLEHYREEFRRIHGAFGAEGAASAALLTDMLQRMKLAWQGLVNTIGGIVAPAISRVLTFFTNLTAAVRQWIANNPQVVTGFLRVAKSLLAVGAALVAIGTAVQILSYVFTPKGLLAVGVGLLVWWSGALDKSLRAFGDWVGGIEIGGRTVSQWFATLGQAWQMILPLFRAGADAMLATFRWLWAEVKIGFANLWLHIANSLNQFVVKILMAIENRLTSGNVTSMIEDQLLKGLSGAMEGLSSALTTSGVAAGLGINDARDQADALKGDMVEAWGAAGEAAKTAGAGLAGIADEAIKDFGQSDLGKFITGLNKPFAEFEMPKIELDPEAADLLEKSVKNIPGAVTRGSAEAYRATVVAPAYAGADRLARQQLDEQKKANTELAKIAKNTRPAPMVDTTHETSVVISGLA